MTACPDLTMARPSPRLVAGGCEMVSPGGFRDARGARVDGETGCLTDRVKKGQSGE